MVKPLAQTVVYFMLTYDWLCSRFLSFDGKVVISHEVLLSADMFQCSLQSCITHCLDGNHSSMVDGFMQPRQLSYWHEMSTTRFHH